jgi:quercetin dioxygenase-like cupin family protein
MQILIYTSLTWKSIAGGRMRHWKEGELIGDRSSDRFRQMVVQGSSMRAGLLGYMAGDVVGEHAHRESDEVFLILSGDATFYVDDEPVTVTDGDLLYLTAGERHEIRVGDRPLKLLAAVAPNLDDAWVADQTPGGHVERHGSDS